MDRKEKIAFILQANRVGVSKLKIDPKGRGKRVARLQSGNARMKESVIDEMYENAKKQRQAHNCKWLSNLVGKKERSLHQITQDLDKVLPDDLHKDLDKITQDTLDSLQAQIQTLSKTIKVHSKEIVGLIEKTNEMRASIILLEYKGIKPAKEILHKDWCNDLDKITQIDGWRITQKETHSNGKVYLKWYARKTINRKLRWIYIGRDKSQAGRKIEAYCKKHGL